MLFSFENIIAWQKPHDFVLEVYILLNNKEFKR